MRPSDAARLKEFAYLFVFLWLLLSPITCGLIEFANDVDLLTRRRIEWRIAVANVVAHRHPAGGEHRPNEEKRGGETHQRVCAAQPAVRGEEVEASPALADFCHVHRCARRQRLDGDNERHQRH